MKTKEIFDQLRVTTMEVANPLIYLAAHRGKMIKVFLQFVQSDHIDDLEQLKIIELYNAFALRDQELVDIAQGKASDELL
jgi:hypothetical protein